MLAHDTKPVLKGVAYFLAHVPSMVRNGFKPYRDVAKDPPLLTAILRHLQTFEKAVAYPPNQVFIGNLDPDDLIGMPAPWYKNLIPNATRWGPFGEIMPEGEFYGMLKICDEFQLLFLEEGFLKKVHDELKNHPLFSAKDLQKLDKGVPHEEIETMLSKGHAMPIYTQGDQLVGCLQRAHEEDASLVPEILEENLAARASAVMALRHLIAKTGEAQEIDYLLGCGEEAVGDRYNRGGGSLSKAIGELCGCNRATGSDVKAFCCAPVHAIVLAASLVAYGLPIRESLPTFMHPNESLDGAITSDARKGQSYVITTWEWLNNPIILELLRQHGKRLNFIGVILQRTRFESEFGKHVTAACTSQMARLLGVEGAIFTRMSGSGNQLMDVMWTVQAYEKKGIKTVLVTPEQGGGENEIPLPFYVPEATAMISTGDLARDRELPVPAKVLGCEKDQLVVPKPKDPPFSPWSKLTVDRWGITGGGDWLGVMNNTCKEY